MIDPAGAFQFRHIDSEKYSVAYCIDYQGWRFRVVSKPQYPFLFLYCAVLHCAILITHICSTARSSAMLGHGVPISSQYSRLCPAWLNLKKLQIIAAFFHMLTHDLNSFE